MDRQALRDGGTSLQVAPKGLAWATSLGTGTTLEGGECAGETRRGASLQEEEIGAGKRGWEPCVPQRPRRAEPPGETERSSRLPLLWVISGKCTFGGSALPLEAVRAGSQAPLPQTLMQPSTDRSGHDHDGGGWHWVSLA